MNIVKRKRNHRSVRVHHFTLLEILIALFILTLALTGIGFQSARLISHERFERAMEIVSDQIDFAYELLLLHQTDFTMTLSLQNKTLICTYDIANNNEQFKKTLARSQTIKGVETLSLNGEPASKIVVHFSKDFFSEHAEIGFHSRKQQHLFTLKGVVCKK